MDKEEELRHYPMWLREYILPTELMNCIGRQRQEEFEKALRRIHDNRKIDPAYEVIFEITLQSIRSRFRVNELEERISCQDQQIRDLTESVKKLKKEVKKLKKKENP